MKNEQGGAWAFAKDYGPQVGEARVQAILDRMTLEEKIACLGGSAQDKVDDGNTVLRHHRRRARR